MTRTIRLTSWTLALTMGACYANTPTTAVSGDTGALPVVDDQKDENDEAGGVHAAHVFRPRQHPPRHHAVPAPPPDLASLPRLVDRTRQCFGVASDDVPAIASQQAKPRPSRVRSGSPGTSIGSAGSAPSSTGSGYGRGAAAPTGGAHASADSWGGSVKGESSAGGAHPPPPAASRPTDSSTRSPSRKEKKRSRDQARPASAAESAPAEDREAGAPVAQDMDEAYAKVPASESSVNRYHDWGASIYLSNDDTMSLSSAQRILYAIDQFLPLPAAHIRPHELLNYFSFDTEPVARHDDFSVLASIAPTEEEGIHSLALAVRGRPMDRETRRNVGLTYVIDRSGSMAADGRMSYLKRGLLQSVGQLKTGDVVNLVVFDHGVCTPIENFVVGRDQPRVLERALHSLSPRGSTDLHSGLRHGYKLADAAYRPEYSNRVVLVTDALTNTGVTDEDMISMISHYYDSRRIRLSGVGVGHEFNDGLLDRLTERGKGAYVFLGSEAEVDAVFGSRFVSLIETVATDVHFQLHLPPSLRMNVFYGEESSVVKEDVQAIHYFANTSQLFLSDLMAKDGRLREDDTIMLTIEYEHPETGAKQLEEYAFRLGDIDDEVRNVQKGRMVMTFVDGLAALAARPVPARYGSQPGSWEDEWAWQSCATGREQLEHMSAGLADDPEVRRVSELWDRYCARYERPRRPVHRAPAEPDAWPGAAAR